MEGNLDFNGMDDTFAQLHDTLDTIDMSDNLNFENADFMSSEFFDSVLSMEHSSVTSIDNDLDYNPGNKNLEASPLNVELNSDAEELRFTDSCSPDSDLSSNVTNELNDFIILNNNNTIPETKLNNDTLTVKTLTTDYKSTTPSANKIILNNIKAKKVILSKPLVGKSNNKKIACNTKILKVQSISGKARPVLLPFSVSDVKHIRIINGKDLTGRVKIRKLSTSHEQNSVENYFISSPEEVDDDSDSITEVKPQTKRQYPAVMLSEEEKHLLKKEGINLPTHYPLTKGEERDLKRIRRKIRNKISAQDSRKRKKEYVDGLEDRVKKQEEENKFLLNKLKQVENQNHRLTAQLNKWQTLFFNGSKATPIACVMIVFISALLVSLPNINVNQKLSYKTNDQQQIASRRALLSSQQATVEEQINAEDALLFNADDESELVNTNVNIHTDEISISKFTEDYEWKLEDSKDNPANKYKPETEHEKGISSGRLRSLFEEADYVDDDDSDVYITVPFDRNKEDKKLNKRGFIESDVDDFYIEPTLRKKKKTEEIDEPAPPDELMNTVVNSSVLSATLSVNSSKKG